LGERRHDKLKLGFFYKLALTYLSNDRVGPFTTFKRTYTFRFKAAFFICANLTPSGIKTADSSEETCATGT